MLCLYTNAQVTPFRPGVTESGINYFLPRTCLHITIETECQEYTPGEYAAFASHFLRIAAPSTEKEEEWTIKKVTVQSYGSADSQKAYTIQYNNKNLMPLVTLASDGRLLAINAECAQPENLSQPYTEQLPTEHYDTDKYKTPEMLAATSVRKAAEIAASEIYDIRENRALLTKGQADFMPKDGEQLRLMLEDLQNNEAALMQLFRGSRKTSKHVFTLDYIPQNYDGSPQILFRFSPKYGFCAADDLSGMPYTIVINDQHNLPTDEVPVKGKAKEIKDLRYCIAGQAQVCILSPDNITLSNSIIPFAQLGRVEHLGGALFDKKFKTKVFLNPDTGGLMHIESNPTAF